MQVNTMIGSIPPRLAVTGRICILLFRRAKFLYWCRRKKGYISERMRRCGRRSLVENRSIELLKLIKSSIFFCKMFNLKDYKKLLDIAYGLLHRDGNVSVRSPLDV